MNSDSDSVYSEVAEILAEVEASLVLQAGKQQFLLYRAHAVAIRNWLGKYRVPADAPGNDRVRGYLEAYYHLRAMGAWPQATRVRRRSLRVKKDEAMQKWQRFEQSFLAGMPED